MNVILILSIHSAVCLTLFIILLARTASEGNTEDFGGRLFVTGSFTVCNIVSVFTFPYPYLSVNGFRWYWFLIAYTVCLLLSLITYKRINRQREEYDDPPASALFSALAGALVVATLFIILLMNGILSYRLPSGEDRVFLHTFLESTEITERENTLTPTFDIMEENT